MTMAAVLGDAAHLARCSMLRASPDATGRHCRVSVCDVCIARAAAMVIDVACGPMAYKTQLLA